MALILSLYFTLFLNLTLFRDVLEVFSNLENYNIFFLLSIPVTFIAAFNILFLPFTIKYIEKPFFIVLLVSAAMVDYAMFNYGTIFDKDMIDNFAKTNVAEASSYFNGVVILWVGLTGVLPALLLLFARIHHPGVVKDFLYKGGSFLVSVIVILIIAAFFYKDYSSVIRNNKILRKEVNPTYYVAGVYKYVRNTYFSKPQEYQYIGLDAQKLPREKNDLLVFVVGETARSMNYSLNGYERDTNKYTENIKNLTYFKNVTSCGTATAVSLPCMFSLMGKNHYSKSAFNYQDNLTDILKRADIGQLWFENNSGSQDVTKRIDIISSPKTKSEFCNGLTCTDDYLTAHLQEEIDKLKQNDNIIYLHVIGSHGPTYFERYPKDHEVFTPVCAKSDIQNCTDEEIANTYDNTILFTDYIVSQVIEILKKNQDRYNVSMIYMSDHGESLGESGVYLHGLPYAIAPSEQTHVPLMTWFSDDTLKAKKIDLACLRDEAKTDKYSHDNLAHTLLGFMDVKTSAYKADMDILGKCRHS